MNQTLILTRSPLVRVGRVGRVAAVCLGLLLACLCFGVSRASADSSYWVAACAGPVAWSQFNDLGSLATNQDCTFAKPDGGLGTTTADALSTSIGDTSTSTLGPSAGWVFSAPSGESLIGLSYTGAQFAVDSSSSDGWGAGWFGNRGSGLLADADPTNPGFGSAPQYDCLAKTQGSFDAAPTGNCANNSVNSAGSFNLLTNGSGALSQIAIGVECRASTCSNGGTLSPIAAQAWVASANVQVDDPQNVPTQSASSLPTGTGTGPETGSRVASNSPTFTVNASDPGGVCDLTAALYNSAGSPVATDPVSQSVAYNATYSIFTSAQPCGSTSLNASISPDWSSLPSGTYYLNAYSQIPADYQAGSYGWLYGSGPTDGQAIEIDNTVPSLSYDSAVSQSAWEPASRAVEVDPSDTDGRGTGFGVQSIACNNNQDGSKSATLTVDASQDPVTVPASLWIEGTSSVTCSALATVGTQSASETFTQNVDTQTPSTAFSGAGTGDADVPAVLDAAPGKHASDPQDPAVTVAGSEPTTYSGISSSTCSVNGNSPVTVANGAAIPAGQFADGVNQVSCYSTTGAGLDNSSTPASETVDVEQTAPQVTLGGAAPYNAGDPSSYANGAVQVTVAAAEPDGAYPSGSVFGVASVACSIDGASAQTVDSDSGTFSVTGQGLNPVSCTATNDAGVVSAPVTETIAIDSSAPGAGGGTITSGTKSPSGYTQTDQSITVSFNSTGGAQMKEVRCTLQPPAPAAAVVTDYLPGDPGVVMSNNDDTEDVTIDIAPPGGQLTCQGQDTAGNWSGPESWNFLIDDTPPTGVFEPFSPTDPALVQALLADDGSGVATAQIQIQQAGKWNNLTTNYDPKTGIASTLVPDDRSIPNGTYPLQVVATDNAGNSTAGSGNIMLNSAGQPETVTLPLRQVTQLAAVLSAGSSQVNAVPTTGVLAHARITAVTSAVMTADAKHRGGGHRHHGSKAGKRCTYRRVVTRKANPRRHQKAASKLVKVCSKTKTPTAASTGALTLAYGQKSTVSGMLQTDQHVPIVGAPVQIEQTVAGTPATTSVGAKGSAPAASSTATPMVIGTATTNAVGQFTYQIPAGPSRTLTFVYRGTPVLRTSSASQNEAVDGRSTIRMPRRVVHGRKVTISGQLDGGFLPPGGALVQLWYTTRGGLVQWAPFAQAVHTTASGAWRLTFPVAKRARRITYEFKAVVSTQAGWAYLGTTTPVITRLIH